MCRNQILGIGTKTQSVSRVPSIPKPGELLRAALTPLPARGSSAPPRPCPHPHPACPRDTWMPPSPNFPHWSKVSACPGPSPLPSGHSSPEPRRL